MAVVQFFGEANANDNSMRLDGHITIRKPVEIICTDGKITTKRYGVCQQKRGELC